MPVKKTLSRPNQWQKRILTLSQSLPVAYVRQQEYNMGFITWAYNGVLKTKVLKTHRKHRPTTKLWQRQANSSKKLYLHKQTKINKYN